MNIKTIPGYRWLCCDCSFNTDDLRQAALHTDEPTTLDHWLYEHPKGDAQLPPAREMHSSDSGWPPYVTVVQAGVNERRR